MILTHGGFILLILLPGAWITFCLPLKDMSFWGRLLVGVLLAPFVVIVQFFALRLLGASFELTSILLVGINIPAIIPISRRWSRRLPADHRTMTAMGIVFLLMLLSIAPFLVSPEKRLFTWEAWSQADVVYSIANDHLNLEDAELAGVRLSYPWFGHIYQAVLSYLLGTPPVTNYIWTNLIWLVCMFSLAAAIVRELGGNSFSQIMVTVWLAFGVNFVGGAIGPLVPITWVKSYPILGGIWGDSRYLSWLLKVLFFGQMYFAMGFFMAILYLVIKPWPDRFNPCYVALVGLLLCGIGVIYPVLLPPAAALIGARIMTIILDTWIDHTPVSYKEIFALGSVTMLAAVITYVNTQFLIADRGNALLILRNALWVMRWKAIESIIVTGPLLAGLVLVLPRLWKKKRAPLIIMGVGALVSFVLYTLLDIPWWHNEYKFIFTAAICLSPFPSLAMEPVVRRLGRWALPGVAILTIILAAPLTQEVYGNIGAFTKQGPVVDAHSFDLRLADRELYSGLTDAIREKTPINTVLVLQNTDLYFPTLTQRELYVAPSDPRPHPGILITSDEMLVLVKGYKKSIVEQRRSVVDGLFNPHENGLARAQSLNQVLKLNRPLALVLNERRDATLLEWITTQENGSFLYKQNGLILWFVEPQKIVQH
jgi:hypothetical protein